MRRLERTALELAAAVRALDDAFPYATSSGSRVVVPADAVDRLQRLAHAVREAMPDPTVPPLHGAAGKAGRLPFRYRPAVVVTATGIAAPGRVTWGYERAMRKATGAAIGLTGLLVSLGLLDEGHVCRPFSTEQTTTEPAPT